MHILLTESSHNFGERESETGKGESPRERTDGNVPLDRALLPWLPQSGRRIAVLISIPQLSKTVSIIVAEKPHANTQNTTQHWAPTRVDVRHFRG